MDLYLRIVAPRNLFIKFMHEVQSAKSLQFDKDLKGARLNGVSSRVEQVCLIFSVLQATFTWGRCCDRKSRAAYAQSFALLLLVRTTYMHGVVLHAHPVRGESHNQCNITGEVTTLVLMR